jgi:hypothetical protein
MIDVIQIPVLESPRPYFHGYFRAVMAKRDYRFAIPA